MNRKLYAMICFMAFTALTCACSAEVIDFEDIDDQEEILDNYPGLHFSPGALCYDSSSYSSENYPPHSPTKVIADVGTGSIRVDFDTPVSKVGGWFMTNARTTVYIEAYDVNGVLLDTASVMSAEKSNAYMEVSTPGIKYVIMHDSANYWGMDDFTYEGGPTEAPEFGSLALAVAILLTAPAFAYLLVRKRE